MKINREQQLSTLSKIANTPAVKQNESDGGENKGSVLSTDRIELSTKSKNIDKLKKAMQVAPDLGSEKVAQLKGQISAGTYKVDGKAVAAKMLKSLSELNK